jgi:Tfp pilus assembly protein PilF
VSRRRPAATRAGLAVLIAAVLAVGCAQPQAPPPAVVDLLSRPAERALVIGLRAYEEGQYPEAERSLEAALKHGRLGPRDQAAAHKHLAFLYCTSERLRACEAAFAAARKADPAFVLSRSEAGHPQWGPVYRRVLP